MNLSISCFNPYFSGFRSYTFPAVTQIYVQVYCFNPYFSGFRSYTLHSRQDNQQPKLVSILISVDSGLIHLNRNYIDTRHIVSILISVDSGLIQLIMKIEKNILTLVSILISVDSGLILEIFQNSVFKQCCFNPYFSGFRSYTGISLS